MANKKGVIMYYDLLEQLEDFNDEQFGKIVRALIQYDYNGTTPDFDGELKLAFKMLKPMMDKNKQNYEGICEKNRQNIMKRWKDKDTTEYDRIPNDTTEYETYYNDNDNDIDKNIKKENEIKIYFTNEKVIEAINNWLDYKKEKHQTYKPKGFTALLKSLKRDSDTYGEQYVIDEINYSMTSNYSGIFASKGYKNYNTSYTQLKPATQTTKVYRR